MLDGWTRASSNGSSRAPSLDFGPDVAVGEQHPRSLSGADVSLMHHRRCSSMAEHQLPKLNTRVRFPSSAPTNAQVREGIQLIQPKIRPGFVRILFGENVCSISCVAADRGTAWA